MGHDANAAGATADLTTVEGTLRAYFEALNRSDADACSALFTEDGSLMRNEAPTATGRAAVRDAYATAFEVMRLHREVHVDHIRERGDVAYGLTETTGTVTIVANEITFPAVSRELFVLERVAAEWRIAEYMFNNITPAAQ